MSPYHWRCIRALASAILASGLALVVSCSSFAYLHSDDYLQAGIRITTDPGSTSGLQLANRWSTEFASPTPAEDVGRWAANRLARQGRRDAVVLIELISACIPPVRGADFQNMWRISVFSQPSGKQGPGEAQGSSPSGQ